jgi:hypothetical protein
VLSAGLIRHRLWRHSGSWGLGGGKMLRTMRQGGGGMTGWVAPLVWGWRGWARA